MSVDELRKNEMMAYLLDALEDGQDIGHYGRLVFAMVGHHFMDVEELVGWLTRDASVTQAEARALALQELGGELVVGRPRSTAKDSSQRPSSAVPGKAAAPR